MPWAVMLMVCGVTVLTSLLQETGGSELFTNMVKYGRRSDTRITLRLARDAAGSDVVPTPEEAERGAKEAALARIAELEAELAAKR